MRKKMHRYEVTKVWTEKGSKPSVKVGTVLFYKSGRGATHSEVIMDMSIGKITETWQMKKIGTCFVEGEKVVECHDLDGNVVAQSVLKTKRKKSAAK